MRFVTLFQRALRLRCPRCGTGKLFRGWLTMPTHCDDCGWKYQREPGYFLGSIYFNYGVTAFLVTAIYLPLFFVWEVPSRVLLPMTLAFCVLFPLWFFRYARALWMAWDFLADPPTHQPDARAARTSLTPARSAPLGGLATR